MNELVSWLWPIPIAVGAWLAGWLACDWRNGRHRRQDQAMLQRLRAKPIPPHPLWDQAEALARSQAIEQMLLNRPGLPTTAATLKTSADTDTAQGTSPPVDIPLPPMTVDGLPLAVEDMSWARRSSFRVVDSPASTEET